MHLLIADPDPSSQAALSQLVGAWGYDPVCVSHGAAALRILSGASSPQLAVLAWNLPGLGGLEVCKALRARPGAARSSYIILTTERPDSPEVSEALGAGFDDVLPIPPEPDRLRATLHAGSRILQLQTAVEELERLRAALVEARRACHDLNQPLQIIRGWVDLLLLDDTSAGEANRAALEVIATSVDRAAELVHRLHALARSCTPVNEFQLLEGSEGRVSAAH